MVAIEPLMIVRIKFLVDQMSQTLLAADFRDIGIGELHCLLDRLRKGEAEDMLCYLEFSVSILICAAVCALERGAGDLLESVVVQHRS